MIGLDALAKGLAVAANAADRDAAKVDAVIAFFAPDESGFLAHSLGAPVGACHLERGVGRLRARAGKEHVVETGGGQFLEFVGQFKRERMAKLKRW